MTCQLTNRVVRLVVPNRVQLWLAGPLVAVKLSELPLTVMLVKCACGGGPLETTLIVPLMARLLVFHARPTPGVVGLTLLKAPPKVPALNSLKLSPTTREGPVAVRLRVPP